MSLFSAVLLAGLVAQAPQAGLALAVEARAESLRYRFENPSSFDTAELVPHFFEQTYDTGNVWVGGRAGYALFGRAAETRVSFTPQITTRADDFDTFFQPDGNIVVTGTTGNASLRAWQISQRIVTGGSSGLSFGLGYTYRGDSARYHEGTRITTMTAPPSERRELVTTREYASSQLHQVVWSARWVPGPSNWTLSVDASPFTFGRLAIELPDKYPGRTIRFYARGAALDLEAAFRWPIAVLNVEMAARVSRSFPYSSGAALHIRSAALVLRVGTR
jgi:hypothetical protein